jgi:predicted methyltransferase
MTPLILSHFEVKPLLAARRDGVADTSGSADLGRTRVAVAVREDGAWFDLAAAAPLRWAVAERIAADPNKCFRIAGVRGEAVEELRVFSATTGWVRTLFPTGSAPTTLVAGFTMHRIQGVDPLEDTRRKLAAVEPLRGRVLDTATGLGYTAIAAARVATQVVTVELDPAALDLARANPWSSELFAAGNIEQRVGDVGELVAGFADASFARVVHDPPSFKLAGELYSGAFYRELHRVLARDGGLSHYIGDPASPHGERTTRGVVERLRAAGFRRVVPVPAAYGVAAWK